MKSEEIDYLKMIHKSSGYKPQKIYNSINKLQNSQTSFKILNRELKKKDTMIRNLEIKIDKLKARLEKANKPVLKIKTKSKNEGRGIFLQDMEEEDYKKHRESINRIERHLETDRDYTKTDIKKELLINYKKLDFSIAYLINKGIIESEIVEGIVRYRKCK